MAPDPVTARNQAQVTALFGGRDLVEPGLVAVNRWPSGAAGAGEKSVGVYGAVARV